MSMYMYEYEYIAGSTEYFQMSPGYQRFSKRGATINYALGVRFYRQSF